MVVVGTHATFAVLAIGFCLGLVARLNGAFCFRGVGVIVVGTKHISSLLERDNAWLNATAHRAVVESPDLQRRETKSLWRLGTSPAVLGPTSERVAVLGRYALGKPGDCMRPDSRHVASGERYVNEFVIVIVLGALTCGCNR
jgi:hypothetical protein